MRENERRPRCRNHTAVASPKRAYTCETWCAAEGEEARILASHYWVTYLLCLDTPIFLTKQAQKSTDSMKRIERNIFHRDLHAVSCENECYDKESSGNLAERKKKEERI